MKKELKYCPLGYSNAKDDIFCDNTCAWYDETKKTHCALIAMLRNIATKSMMPKEQSRMLPTEDVKIQVFTWNENDRQVLKNGTEPKDVYKSVDIGDKS